MIKKNQKKEKSYKPQAASLTAGPGSCRMELERNKHVRKTKKEKS